MMRAMRIIITVSPPAGECIPKNTTDQRRFMISWTAKTYDARRTFASENPFLITSHNETPMRI
jgi:hypothetical protein